MNRLRMAVLATAVGSPLLLNAGIAAAQDAASNAELLQLLKQQAELIKKLEQRLATLEGKQPAAPATAAAAVGEAAGPVADKSAEVRAAITDTQQGLLEAQLAQLSALGSAGAGSGGGSGNLRWRGAPVFRSADGYFTFKPRGRLSLDWSGTEGSSFDARNIYGTEATDLRLGAEGTIGKLGYKLDVTFTDNAAGVRDFVTAERWFASQFAWLVGRMAELPEPGGPGSMLDHSLVLWAKEMGDGRLHDCVSVPFVLAGGAGGLLATDRYLRFDHAPHQRLLVSVCHAMGVMVPAFGDPARGAGPLAGVLS